MRNRLVTIGCVALAVRFAIIVWNLSGAHVTPQPFMSHRYFQEGYAISAGWGYSTGTDDDFAKLTPLQKRVESGLENGSNAAPRPRGFYAETLHPPGMSLLVAALHRVFGGTATLPVMLFGALLDVAAALVLYVMVCSVLGAGIAFVAALTYAVFLPQAYAATAGLSPDGLESFFVIVGFALVLRGIRVDERPSYKWFALAGFAFGVGGYFRPDYDLMAIALLPFLWAYCRRFSRTVKAVAIIVAVTYATLLPYAYRNHRLYGQWIFTSTAVGSTMVEGLGEFQNPWGFKLSDVEMQRVARAHGYTSAWSPEGSDYLSRVFLKAVAEHPLAFVVSVAKRVPLAVAPAFQFGFANPLKTKSFAQQRETGADRYQAALKSPVYVAAAYWDALLFGAVSFGFLVCTLCMLWLERSRWPLIALLVAPHLYGIAVHVLSELEPRYLLPSMFSLMIGFGYCVHVFLAARIRSAGLRMAHSP